MWSNNIKESEEVAKRTFLELEQHKNKIEEAKMTIQNYTVKMETQTDADVKDLLALGEEEILQPSVSSQPKKQKKKVKDDSDSEMEDWEEVNGRISLLTGPFLHLSRYLDLFRLTFLLPSESMFVSIICLVSVFLVIVTLLVDICAVRFFIVYFILCLIILLTRLCTFN